MFIASFATHNFIALSFNAKCCDIFWCYLTTGPNYRINIYSSENFAFTKNHTLHTISFSFQFHGDNYKKQKEIITKNVDTQLFYSLNVVRSIVL